MLYCNFLVSWGLICASHAVHQDYALLRAEQFRAFVRAQATHSQASMLSGSFRDRSVLPDGRILFEFSDGLIVLSPNGTSVLSFRVVHRRRDSEWPDASNLTPSRLAEIAQGSFQAAGHEDTISVIKTERWGGAGAEFPSGPTNFYRLQAKRTRSGIRLGFMVNADFDIDALTGQLLGLSAYPSPTMPAVLSPAITRDAALATVMAAYFAEHSGLQISEQAEAPCQLTVSHPKAMIPVDNPEVPAYVRLAAAEGRGILAYEMVLNNLRGETGYAAVDARTGQIMYRARFGGSLGAKPKPVRPSKWRWAVGPVHFLLRGRRHKTNDGDVSELKKPKSVSAGTPIILLRSGVAVLAKFHAKEGLLSRETTLGPIFGKPSKSLLAALRLAER